MRVRGAILGGGAVVAWLAIVSLAAAPAARLAEAVKNRNTAAVRALLQQRVDVNAPLPDGTTALHWAAHWDDLETARLLIRAGARVDAADEYGVTALSLACTNGNAAIVSALLEGGANPNGALPTGETPLMTAARTGKADAVSVLLNHKAEVNAKEPLRGQTPLMWAASQRHADVVRLLIEHGADVHAKTTTGFTPYLFAARAADLEAMKILLDQGIPVNEASTNRTTALVLAASGGRMDAVKFLLDRGADPNLGPGYTPLHVAAGGDAPEDGEFAAGSAAAAKLELAQLLLARGANPNARGTRPPGSMVFAGGTPFLIAAQRGNVPMMRLLVSKGADPNVTTSVKWTALMLAAGVGSAQPGESDVPERAALEAVKLCVELGNDVNATNQWGETPLHAAAYRGVDNSSTIVQFLVDHGAKVNVKNERGWTPLLMAEGLYFSGSNTKNATTAALLKTFGADPSPSDFNRNVGIRSNESWYPPGKEPARFGGAGGPPDR